MAKYVKHDGVWKEPADSLRHDGVWKDKETWVKHNGIWKLVVEPFDSGPGPQEMQYDETTDTGYYGECSADDLPSGDGLAYSMDLTAGYGINSDAGWLKFYDQGKVLFVAKKPFRMAISWVDINNKNLVTGDEWYARDGYVYWVWLLSGGYHSPGTGSEWNRLIYRIHKDEPEDQEGDNWATLGDADIVVGSGNGRETWCQEQDGLYITVRGSSGLSDFLYVHQSNDSSAYGWRPVLELVQE